MFRKYIGKLTIFTLALALILSAGMVYAHDGEEHDDDDTAVAQSEIDLEGTFRGNVSPRTILPVRNVPIKRMAPFSPSEGMTPGIRIEARERAQIHIPDSDDFAQGEWDYVNDRIRTKHRFEDGLHTLEGVIMLPTPCHSFETEVVIRESFPEQVTVNFLLENELEEGTACVQVIEPAEFEVQFEASENARINVAINGEGRELRDPERTARNDRAEEVRERNEERRAEVRARIAAQAQARVEAYFDRMVERIEAAFERMERLIERTESRINKLEENGLSTEASLEFVAQSKSDLADGQADFQVAVEAMEDGIFDEESPREIYSSIKESVRDAISALKDSKTSLKDAVRVLKAEVSTDTEVEADDDTDDSEDEDEE